MAAIALPYHSNPYNWTHIVSRKNRSTMKKNNINKWIDQLLRDGNGFAHNLFKFFDLHQFIELRCTTRILDTYVLYYIQNNPIFDPTTPVRDIKNFMLLFPHAMALAIPWQHNNHMMLEPNIFVGSKIRCIDLYGVDFTKIPDFNPANFTNVKKLCLQHCTIDGENSFSCMQNVCSLVLSSSRVYTSSLDCLPYLQNLEHLDISYVSGFIFDTCLEYLDGITSFHAKYSEDVTDALIAVITRSGCLMELDITGCRSLELTVASIPLLKTVPFLTVNLSKVEFENCDVCGRERSISNIAYHLMYECNMNCQLCNESIEICNESRHLVTECTQNHIECSDCGVMILGKNHRRHRGRCMNRLITCTHCCDMEPYSKKDFCFHLQNYEENSFEHFKSLRQKKALLNTDLDDLQQKINDMIWDTPAIQLRLRTLGGKSSALPRTHHIPPKHTMFMRQMERNIAKHAKKPLKQLYVECNMKTQLLAMREKYKNQIEHIIEELDEQCRQDEDEYWSHRSYMYDIDDHLRERRRDLW